VATRYPIIHSSEERLMAQDATDWYDDAACQGLGFAEFFDGDGSAAGRRICVSCPVRAKCLQFAVNNGITAGIWGGLTPAERRAARLPRAWVA
jgi:WhiB family transcriptional regulator, redox-sensing transcriptional regulator